MRVSHRLWPVSHVADLNLPITALAVLLIWKYLAMAVPQDSLKAKLKKLDLMCAEGTARAARC